MNPHETPLFTAAEAAALHAAGGDLAAIGRVTADSVERIVDARLAPIRALAEEWSPKYGAGCPTTGGALLRAALDVASAPVSAQQDHDGTEGQGKGERAGDGGLDLDDASTATSWTASVASRYRPRWRTDAGSYVLTFAGKWASAHTWADRAALEDVVRQMPNGNQIEIVEVDQ